MHNLFIQYWSTMRGLHAWAILTIALLVTSGLLEGLALYFLAPALEPGTSDIYWSTTLRALYIFALIGFSSALIKYFAERELVRLRCRIDIEVKSRMSNALFNMYWPSFVSIHQGDITKSILIEAFHISLGTQYFLTGVSSIMIAVIFISLTLTISVPMTLLTLVFGSVAALCYRAASRRASERTADASRVSGEIGNQLGDAFGHLKFLRSTSEEKSAEKSLVRCFEDFGRHFFQSQKYGLFVRAFFEMGGIFLIAGFLYYSIVVTKQPLSQTLIFLAIFYRLAPRLLSANENFFQAKTFLAWNDSFKERESIALAAVDAPHGTKIPVFSKEITFDSVFFSYPNAASPSISELSLTIRKGTIVALIGSSGSGKSTCIDLITGLLRPSKGQVALDNIPLEHVDLVAWRRKIGVVLQESPILHATVLENIAWGDSTPNREHALKCTELSHAREFIDQLPAGLDTELGAKGGRLSGGQRQRIALARALYRNPELLILDEATSALDSDSESHIKQAISSLKGRITIIIVAHRLATVQTADAIHVMNAGTLSESGSWNDLSSNSSSELHRMIALQELSS